MTTFIKTAGTASTTTYALALRWLPGYNSGHTPADLATMATALLNDQGNVRSIYPGFDEGTGILTLPGGRGRIQLLTNDWLMIDPSGWPIVISANVLPRTLTRTGTTNATTTLTVTLSALNAGWTVGMTLAAAEADIPAGTTITAISIDGLTITMSAAATGSNAGQTITAGSWTHS